MARILFIQNLHPTEANAIRISRMAAEMLQKQGHEIFIKKFKPEETAYGIVYRLGMMEEIPDVVAKIGDIRDTTSAGYKQRVLRWIEEIKPDLAFDFHCTPDNRLSKVVFVEGAHPEMKIIDIPAVYKKLPEKLQGIMVSGIYRCRDSDLHTQYWTRTTDWQASKKIIGLNPKRIAGQIVQRIDRMIRASAPSPLPQASVLRKIMVRRAKIIK